MNKHYIVSKIDSSIKLSDEPLYLDDAMELMDEENKRTRITRWVLKEVKETEKALG